MMRSFLAAVILPVLLTGCSLAPDYAVPSAPRPAAYKENGDWAKAAPEDASVRGAWWKDFHDQNLDTLEDGVTAANQNLKIALAQYEQARAAASAARSAYFPAVTGNTGGQRERESTTTANSPSAPAFYDFTFGADLTYEIDLWGRVRNTVAANEDQAQASAADLAGVDLSLHAELAIDYFALRGDDEAQKILDDTVMADQKALDLTRRRYKGGVAAEADVDQAETQLANAKTQATDMHLQRAQLEHAIAILIGKPPADFSLAPAPLAAAPPSLDAGLPSTLLERRPDIAAAERRTAAANAEIGVARAAYFPTFSLTGAFGYETSSVANWFTAPSSFWALGPSAALTLFDAGQTSALNEEARAAYDQAVASYRQTVLAAYQEVEDNLAALHHLQDESKTQDAAKAAADRALTQANDRYVGGAVTYLDVVVAENADLQARLATVTILTRRLTAGVQLIQALGGGWQAENSEAPKKTP